ncbi:MAG: 2Fe-2S iron-sulfur cluster-binding protein, partial [Phycisphaeraceae bacterium]|nr:2Fe-2S iron-sulfur cluster-binding protein [Phycisphaeraceae bacterium]
MSETTPKKNRPPVRIRILRQDDPDAVSRWETFEVPWEPMLNITSCLQSIAGNPVTVEGRETTPVAYEVACLEEVCGSCTMVINGRVRQGCSALVDQLRDGEEPITLEPMSKFPVVRDLVVDRSRMF